jgi:hypothetical protein
MGRKSIEKIRKRPTPKVNAWLATLLIDIQDADLGMLTMDDLVRISGKSKSTFYTYFKRKEDVLLAACQTRVYDILYDLGKVDLAKDDISSIYKQLIEIFASGTAGIRLGFLQSIRKHYEAIWREIEILTDTYVGMLSSLYSRGMSMGLYKDFSVDLLTTMDKLFVIEIVTNSTLFTDEKYTVSDLIRDYLNLRLGGLIRN